MAKVKKNTAKKITGSDGSISWEVETTYDVTEQGIVFGAKRNYNPNFIKKLVDSVATKQAVEYGYSLVMYGHGARGINNKMWATETHPLTGQAQFPLGRVTKAEMHSKWLTLTMILPQAKDNHVETIVELMKSGIGGFSTHFSTKENVLQGVDFVLARNFAENRVEEFLSDNFLSDAINQVCNSVTGECKIDVKLREEASEIVEGRIELIPQTMELLRLDPIINTSKDTIKRVADKQIEVNYLQGQLEAFKGQLELANERIRLLEIELKGKDKAIQDVRMELPKVQEASNAELEDSNRVIDELKEQLELRKFTDDKTLKSLKEELVKMGLSVNAQPVNAQPIVTVDINNHAMSDIFRDSFISDGIDSREANRLNEKALQLALGKANPNSKNKAVNKGYPRVTIM